MVFNTFCYNSIEHIFMQKPSKFASSMIINSVLYKRIIQKAISLMQKEEPHSYDGTSYKARKTNPGFPLNFCVGEVYIKLRYA